MHDISDAITTNHNFLRVVQKKAQTQNQPAASNDQEEEALLEAAAAAVKEQRRAQEAEQAELDKAPWQGAAEQSFIEQRRNLLLCLSASYDSVQRHFSMGLDSPERDAIIEGSKVGDSAGGTLGLGKIFRRPDFDICSTSRPALAESNAEPTKLDDQPHAEYRHDGGPASTDVSLQAGGSSEPPASAAVAAASTATSSQDFLPSQQQQQQQQLEESAATCDAQPDQAKPPPAELEQRARLLADFIGSFEMRELQLFLADIPDSIVPIPDVRFSSEDWYMSLLRLATLLSPQQTEVIRQYLAAKSASADNPVREDARSLFCMPQAKASPKPVDRRPENGRAGQEDFPEQPSIETSSAEPSRCIAG